MPYTMSSYVFDAGTIMFNSDQSYDGFLSVMEDPGELKFITEWDYERSRVSS